MIQKRKFLIILLALFLINAPSFAKPVAASEYDVTWTSYYDVNGNGQCDQDEIQGKFLIHYSAPDSAEPSSPISIDLTVEYIDDEFARAYRFTFKNMKMSLRETPGGPDIVSDISSLRDVVLRPGESISTTFDFVTPSERGVYYVVFEFKYELVGGARTRFKGTYYSFIDTGELTPELCPTIENKLSSQLSLSLSESSIVYGESVTLSGSLSPEKSTEMTIEFSTDGGSTWQTLETTITQSNGFYSYDWTPTDAGAYLLRARWLGDDMYASATSPISELTVLNQLSCVLSSEMIAHIFSHGAVTIFGGITPAVPDATVHIYYRTGDGEWLVLASVNTDINGGYSYSWLPPSVGKYDMKATWSGDALHEGVESPIVSVTVEDYTLLTIIAAVAVVGVASFYFLKIRKKPVQPPSIPPALTCPHCGAPITPGADYCPNCGKKVR